MHSTQQVPAAHKSTGLLLYKLTLKLTLSLYYLAYCLAYMVAAARGAPQSKAGSAAVTPTGYLQ